MPGTRITKNREDYLNEIYRLQASKNRALKSAEIAKALKVTRPSVSEMLKKLSSEKLVEFSGKKGITLTKKGAEKARYTIRKHQLLEIFFKDVLNLEKKFHNEAHKIEHELSDDACDRLEIFLKNPATCPDGNPVPAKKSGIIHLSDAKSGCTSKIVFSSANDKEAIERMVSLGLLPNRKIHLKNKTKNGVLIEIEGKDLEIEENISSKIFVECPIDGKKMHKTF